jgi:hypothetical protein
MARVAPAAVFIVLSCLAAGALGDRLELLRDPQLNPVESYNHLGTRGAVVAGAGLAFFGFALLSGAVLGRLLPALLLAGALAVGSFVGVIVLTDTMLHDETVIVMGVDGGVPGRVIEYGVLSPAGERLTFHEAYLRYGDQVDALLSGETPWPTVLWVNPPEIYPLVVARMTVLFAALGLASIVLTFAVVDRRKP